MTAPFRLVCGSGIAGGGAHALLVHRIVERAKAIGFVFRRIEHSRCTRSRSRYVDLHDAAGRRWILRVSNHRAPGPSGHPTPHFDLVSIDGVDGVEQATDFLRRAWSGEIAWHDPAERVRQPRRRR